MEHSSVKCVFVLTPCLLGDELVGRLTGRRPSRTVSWDMYESSLVSLSFGMWNPLSQKPHANGLFYCSVEPESKGREVGRHRHPVSRGREAEVGPVKEKSVAEGNNNLL